MEFSLSRSWGVSEVGSLRRWSLWAHTVRLACAVPLGPGPAGRATVVPHTEVRSVAFRCPKCDLPVQLPLQSPPAKKCLLAPLWGESCQKEAHLGAGTPCLAVRVPANPRPTGRLQGERRRPGLRVLPPGGAAGHVQGTVTPRGQTRSQTIGSQPCGLETDTRSQVHALCWYGYENCI